MNAYNAPAQRPAKRSKITPKSSHGRSLLSDMCLSLRRAGFTAYIEAGPEGEYIWTSLWSKEEINEYHRIFKENIRHFIREPEVIILRPLEDDA